MDMSVTHLWFCFVLSANIANGLNQYLMCKQVEDIFTSPEGTIPPPARIQGAPGKRGPSGFPGERGPSGPQGPPGRIDHGMISASIETMIDPVIEELNDKIQQLNATVQALQRDASTTEDFCDIKRNGSCFWAVSHKKWDMTFAQAKEACAQKQAKPANVYNRGHYDQMVLYIRSMFHGTNKAAHLWLGMSIDPSTEAVTLSGGGPALYMKYYPSQPTSGPGETLLSLYVVDDPQSSSQGMFDYTLARENSGVVCEMKLINNF